MNKSLFGVVWLYCPVCGIRFGYGSAKGVWHFKEFGYCCSKECWKRAEMKYARMVLGKSEGEVDE